MAARSVSLIAHPLPRSSANCLLNPVESKTFEPQRHRDGTEKAKNQNSPLCLLCVSVSLWFKMPLAQNEAGQVGQVGEYDGELRLRGVRLEARLNHARA